MSGKRKIRIAIAGNPNSGKSTIFNALTGSSVSVGNWPGVTVERQEGRSVYQGHEVVVVDLPGTYALNAWSIDAQIARQFIVNEQPDGVVVVVDAANLERNLYLVVELLEMGTRVIIALNMFDIARSRGMEIDLARLEQTLGVKVVPTVGITGEGIEKLRQAIHDLGRSELPAVPLRIDYGPEIEEAIGQVAGMLKDRVPEEERRWLAIKLLEGEWKGNFPDAVNEVVERLRSALAQRHGHDAASAIIERRYGFIKGVVRRCVHSRIDIAQQLKLTEKIDDILLNRWLGLPIFFTLMALAFFIVFKIGAPLVAAVGQLFELIRYGVNSLLTTINAPLPLISFLGDGLIEGVGSVVQFVPNIFILYLVVSFLEDSGYMARAAFIMDRFMQALGLHGKSFIPMLMGFGCNVPAVLATRTLEARRDRILTVLINPLMSCSARLPVYILFANIFFSRNRWLVVFSLYMLGIVVAMLIARLFGRLFFRAERAPLIMELPPYHAPTLRTVLRPAWLRTRMFLYRAGVVITPAVIVIWLLAHLPRGADGMEESILGKIGSLLAPLLKPAGFGYWWSAVALLAGIVAKEVIIGTLGSIHGDGLSSVLERHFTPVSAYAFLAFTLLYFPCVATFAAIRKELGWRWAVFTAAYTVLLGWLVATIIYQFGRILLTV